MEPTDQIPKMISELSSLVMQIVLATIVVTVTISALGSLLARQKIRSMLLFVTPFSSLGAIAGLIAGRSHESIVGGLLTGMLTIVAALLSYAYSKDALADWRDFIPFSIVGLCLGALAGVTLGQIYRAKWDDYERRYEEWHLRYEKVYLPIMKTKAQHLECKKRSAPQNVARCDELLLK